MKLIPVIDILNGIAVHARRGQRAQYAPLRTRFADQPDVAAIIHGISAELSIDAVYIADLDAIAGGVGNGELIRRIAATYPQINVIVDRGLTRDSMVDEDLQQANIDLVIASETLTSLDDFAKLSARLPATRCLLSLDRNAEQRFGPQELFDDPHLWPQRVIHMNLARVGADGGPDWPGLHALARMTAGHAVFAAGGVRHRADLEALARLPVAAVLVGTALHDGRLTAADLLDPGSAAALDTHA